MKQKTLDERQILFNSLFNGWRDLKEDIQSYTFDYYKFKPLFLKTWQYFIDSARDKQQMSRKDAELLIVMSAMIYQNGYPDDGALYPLFTVCVTFTQGLILAVTNAGEEYYDNMTLWDGYIDINRWDGVCRPPAGTSGRLDINIKDFEKKFEEYAVDYFLEELREDLFNDDKLDALSADEYGSALFAKSEAALAKEEALYEEHEKRQKELQKQLNDKNKRELERIKTLRNNSTE